MDGSNGSGWTGGMVVGGREEWHSGWTGVMVVGEQKHLSLD